MTTGCAYRFCLVFYPWYCHAIRGRLPVRPFRQFGSVDGRPSRPDAAPDKIAGMSEAIIAAMGVELAAHATWLAVRFVKGREARPIWIPIVIAVMGMLAALALTYVWIIRISGYFFYSYCDL